MEDSITTAQPKTAPFNKLTVKEPDWKQPASSANLQKAIKLRIQNKFTEAQKNLTELLAAESPDELSLRSVWLNNQILKTQAQRGHYRQVLDRLDHFATKLNQKFNFMKHSEDSTA